MMRFSMSHDGFSFFASSFSSFRVQNQDYYYYIRKANTTIDNLNLQNMIMTMTTETTVTTATIGSSSEDENNNENNTLLFHQALLIALVTVCSNIGYQDSTELITRIGYYYRKHTKQNVTNDFIQIETNRILGYKTKKEEKWNINNNKEFPLRSSLTQNDKESIIRIVFWTYFDITKNTQMSQEFDTNLVEIGGYGLGMDGTDLVNIVSKLMKEREKLEGRIIGSSPTRTATNRKQPRVGVDTTSMVTPQPGPLFH